MKVKQEYQTCSTCRQTKPVQDFPKVGDHYRWTCRDCRNAHKRAMYAHFKSLKSTNG